MSCAHQAWGQPSDRIHTLSSKRIRAMGLTSSNQKYVETSTLVITALAQPPPCLAAPKNRVGSSLNAMTTISCNTCQRAEYPTSQLEKAPLTSLTRGSPIADFESDANHCCAHEQLVTLQNLTYSGRLCTTAAMRQQRSGREGEHFESCTA